MMKKGFFGSLFSLPKDVFRREGGGASGTERQKTKANSNKGVGRKSREKEPEHAGAKAEEKGSTLPSLAGGGSKERVEADGKADGTAWDFDGD